MIDLRTTLLWWVLTRYHVWAIGSAIATPLLVMIGIWDPAHKWVLWSLAAIPGFGQAWIWRSSWKDRERVRGLMRSRINDAERQWGHRAYLYSFIYLNARNYAKISALRRPDLWGKWMLNVYCGETNVHFASGCDSWPRWVWEPVKG